MRINDERTIQTLKIALECEPRDSVNRPQMEQRLREATSRVREMNRTMYQKGYRYRVQTATGTAIFVAGMSEVRKTLKQHPDAATSAILATGGATTATVPTKGRR